MNLADNFVTTAASQPDHVAIKFDDLELTYAALDGASSMAPAGWPSWVWVRAIASA
jgi:non-ribosomal peptide synthetase component F